MRIYTLPNPTALEKKSARLLSATAARNTEWRVFPNGENFLRVKQVSSRVGVLGRSHPPADNFLRTLLLVDTLRRNGAREIIVWLPYFGYSRQDRALNPGEAVAAASLTAALKAAGATQIVTLDLHSPLVSKESRIPIKTVSFMPELAAALRRDLAGFAYTIVSPDRGGRERAELFAKTLRHRGGICWIEKERSARRVRARKLHGQPQGMTAVLVDDILDTGGTVKEAVRLLRQRGFRQFFLAVTHPVFSAGAAKTVRSLKFKKILASNSLPLDPVTRRACRVTVLDAAGLLARAVKK